MYDHGIIRCKIIQRLCAAIKIEAERNGSIEQSSLRSVNYHCNMLRELVPR